MRTYAPVLVLSAPCRCDLSFFGDCGDDADDDPGNTTTTSAPDDGTVVDEGRETFRYDTCGDEVFWGDTIHLHEAIAGAANGGVGDGVSPNLALAVGLKVDSEALTQDVIDGILD